MNEPLRLHGRMTHIAPGLRVRRMLPALERRTVGPFVFFDEFGPATLAAEPTASETLYLDVTMAANARFSLPPLAPELAVYGVGQDYALDGQAVDAAQMVVLVSGRGAQLGAGPDGTRLVVIGGAPLERPVRIWWNFVSTQRERIARAADDWSQHRFAPIPGETDRIEAPPWRD
ncbi:MAG: pirin-like C-terminal cupin domain-containing protein [Burkholderiaceae bacterium]